MRRFIPKCPKRPKRENSSSSEEISECLFFPKCLSKSFSKCSSPIFGESNIAIDTDIIRRRSSAKCLTIGPSTKTFGLMYYLKRI